jgi:hypothetical protein
MSKPPVDPRDRTYHVQPTWRGLLVAYGMMAAIIAAVALLSYPVLGTVVAVSLGVVSVAGRRGLELYRCLQTCGGFAVDLGDSVQICVTKPSTTC